MIGVQGGEEKNPVRAKCSNALLLMEGQSVRRSCLLHMLQGFSMQHQNQDSELSHIKQICFAKCRKLLFSFLMCRISCNFPRYSDYCKVFCVRESSFQLSSPAWIKISPEATDSGRVFRSDHPSSDRLVPSCVCTMEGEGVGDANNNLRTRLKSQPPS